MTKICTKCKLEKEESEFYGVANSKYRLRSWCKFCTRNVTKVYYYKNRDRYKECRKKYRESDNGKTVRKKYRESDKGKVAIKRYRKSDKCKIYTKKYQESDKYKTYLKSDKYKTSRRKCVNDRRCNDIQYKLACNLRCRLDIALKSSYKSGSAVRDLGCTIAELKIYLEKQFKEGMTWDNWGVGEGKWHIDHEYPLSKVDLTDREQFLRVCHYTNLQPLWASENLKKGNKVLDF